MDKQRPDQARLSFHLLGSQRIHQNHRPLPLLTGKPLSLLAYFLLHPHQSHPREVLAELFWPDSTADRGRRNLSDVLYRLRQAIPGNWLVTDTFTVRLNGGTDLWVDVWAFREAADQKDRRHLDRAVDLYAGDLLPELYDDWLLIYRVELQERFVDVLLRLSAACEQEAHYPEALGHYRRILQIDPAREEAFRGCMRTLARMGRLADALDAYEQLVDLLDRELSAPPARESRELAEQLFRELELQRQAAAQDRTDLLHPTFVGRIQERALLLSAIEEATRGHGAMLAIGGPPGIGKTRLLEEVAAGAEWRDVTVVWGQTPELPGNSPYAALQQAIVAALSGPRAAQVESLLEPAVLAAVAPLFPAWQSLVELPELPLDAARLRFGQAVAAVLAALADIRPLVIVLDDLHWSEPALWQLLESLMPTLLGHRLVFLFAYRRPGIETHAGWIILQRWEREGLLRALRLGPLSLADVARLLAHGREGEAAALWAQSGGSPFYLVQMFAGQSGALSTQTEALQSRLAKFQPETVSAVEAAAVLGRSVPYRLWAACTHLPARALIAAAETLAEQLILLPGEAGYTFVHDIVHEVIYRTIPEERRRELHLQAAHVLAVQDVGNLRGRTFHLEQAGRESEAGMLYAAITEQALAQYAFAEALDAMARMLQFVETQPTAERITLLLETARIAGVLGDAEQQQAALRESRAIADAIARPDLRLDAEAGIADLEAKTGHHEEAGQRFAVALQLAEELEDDRRTLDILLAWADLNARLGENEAAKLQFERAAALARRLPDPVKEGRALEGLGWVQASMGAPEDEVVGWMEAALRVHESSGDVFETARTRLSLFSLLQAAGRWDRFLKMEDIVVNGLRAVQYRRGEAAAHQAICWVRSSLGDYIAAEAAALEAKRLFEAIDDRLGVSISTGALGFVAQQTGQLDVAHNYFTDALAIVRALGSKLHEGFALQDLGMLLVRQEAYAQAVPCLRQAHENWAHTGERLNRLRCEAVLALALVELDQQAEAAQWTNRCWKAFVEEQSTGSELLNWYNELYVLLKRWDRSDDARRVLDAAYQELLRQARSLPTPDLQARFLTRVPVHRSIAGEHLDRQSNPRSIAMRLAHKDAPLGRPLTGDEVVFVTWTLCDSTDDLYENKAERRRHVLQRLLAESAAQNAAPTDDDLAEALGVSRRTILRDMEALAAAGIPIITRSRS